MTLEQVMEKSKALLWDYGPQVLYALALFIIGVLVARIVRAILNKVMGKTRLEGTISGFVSNLIYMTLIAFFAIAALDKLGVETASFTVVIGAAGLAIGFALQGTLSNFAAGVLLVIFRPYKVGDFVETAGSMGTINEIQIFCTILTSPDNKKIIIPNSTAMGGNIINYTAMKTRRVDLVFGIGYGDDLLKAKKILEEIVSGQECILKDPAPTIAVLELGDNSVNFAVRPWVNASDYWKVLFELTEKVKLRFDAEGITIPFPQRDVHIYQETAPTKAT